MNKVGYDKWLKRMDKIINEYTENTVNEIVADAVDIYHEKEYNSYYFFDLPYIGNFNIRLKKYDKAKTYCNSVLDNIRIYISFETWRDNDNIFQIIYGLPPMNLKIGRFDIISTDYNLESMLMPQFESFLQAITDIMKGKYDNSLQ